MVPALAAFAGVALVLPLALVPPAAHADPSTAPLLQSDTEAVGSEAPKGTITLTDAEDSARGHGSGLTVRLHPDFPQVVDYRAGGQELAGRVGDPLDTVTIDEKKQQVEVEPPTVDRHGTRATYHVTVPDLEGVSFDAVITVEHRTVTWTLTNIEGDVHLISIPGLDLASADGAQDGAQLTTADQDVRRGKSGDHFYDLADQDPGTKTSDPSYLAMVSSGRLAAGMETNAVEDNTVPDSASAKRVQDDNSRFVATLAPRTVDDEKTTHGAVSPGTFVVRGSTADQGIGPDEDPYVRVRITGDANGDETVDWQDAAIAARAVQDPINGQDEVSTQVVKHIPFNIDSQATHPFLRTLDDTKRISLATDGLGQSVMLKGYQAEGHDSAHPDYAGNYNVRAGGKDDFDTLVEDGETWNATYGVHVNATESYSEANAFSEDLLKKPITPGWAWMNQAYAIDGPKDLGTGNVLGRFQDLRDETPENLSFLYMDVYYPNGWEGQRLSQGLQDQGWTVSTEWADKFPRYSTWSHWANDESYGGQDNKGLDSQVLRFVNNAHKDVWNPDPLLSNANVKEFEGWSEGQDANAFLDNIWERNLPTKFLQRSDIMSWQKAGDGTTGTIVLEDGTEVTSDVESVDGTTIPTDRTITTDGSTVYEDGKYLLPWSDAAGDREENRLYHWNPKGGTSRWTLTDQWKDQKELTMYRLTDSGRVDRTTVPVKDGKVRLTAKKGSAYVLYPGTKLPKAQRPEWGQGGAVADPGFFSGTLDDWSPQGHATVETDEYGNRQARFDAGTSSISQRLRDPNDPGADLPAGDWSAWAWVEVDPRSSRQVEVSASGDGVSPVGTQQVAQQGSDTAGASTTIDTSTAVNSTGSDEKHGRHFQRVRVTFRSDGSPVTFRVGAGKGSTKVRIDDVRVVPFTAPKDDDSTDDTILFEDFEHVDTGYWPFVTGTAHTGDAQTQLAKKHAPYSESGWYGIDQDGTVVEGGKLIDNTLDGDWSLMANEESEGMIMRTTSSSLQLTPGHRYRVSFDHQTAFADTYSLVVGNDRTGGTVTSKELEKVTIPKARSTKQFSHEFVAPESGDLTWLGIKSSGSDKSQANFVMDDLRVQDLGPADD
jgi:endo-alpha-N-acetylgalactosaminidase